MPAITRSKRSSECILCVRCSFWFKNNEIRNASLNTSRLSENGKPFEARIAIPRLLIRAKYSSSGVLLIIPASGAGDFDGVLGRLVQRKG